MPNDTIKTLQQVRHELVNLRNISDEVRNQVLRSLAQQLLTDSEKILQANRQDLAICAPQFYDRLELTTARLHSISQDVLKIADSPSPINQVLLDKTLANGLRLQKTSVPLGVVAVIYESRPNVTIDVFALAFKAGNATVLKGGKEAYNTNIVLTDLIKHALKLHGLSSNLICLMPPDRSASLDLLRARGLVDVCIPRGSQALIDFVRTNAQVPIIETGAGIVHAYFDLSGDLNKGKLIIDNSKTRRVSVCNALDTLLIHAQRLADLPQLFAPLAQKQVEVLADVRSYEALRASYPTDLLKLAEPEDFGKEFLALQISVKAVASADEAIAHISAHTSGHTEAIIAEDEKVIQSFLRSIDAAVLYVNASTAFTDGGEFGMGAEIGISTQKLHARGPMGLQELTSYKWVGYGNAHIRA